MRLAKPAIDVGLYTNQHEEMLSFWQSHKPVTYSELLPIGGGIRQHRHCIGDSILKINHSRTPLNTSAPCGIHGITLFDSDIEKEEELFDPDGNRLLLKKNKSGDAPNLRVSLIANDLEKSQDFYGRTLGLSIKSNGAFQAGQSEIEISQGKVSSDHEQQAIGFRYLTFQVYDVVAEHNQILAKGGTEGRDPIKLGDVAYISFIRDPDGNWIELSQRKSITGSLS